MRAGGVVPVGSSSITDSCVGDWRNAAIRTAWLGDEHHPR
jgi:hypothetical protein